MSSPFQSTPKSTVDAAVLKSLVAQLEAQVTEQQKQLEAKDQRIKVKDDALAFAHLKIEALEARLRLERIRRYGKQSETLSDLQLELLDVEPGVSSEEVEAESQRDPITPETGKDEDKTKTRVKKKHPGRNKLPAHLERVETIIPCSPEQCTCGRCGKENSVIGYEETEVLDVKPAEYVVTVIKREKRACQTCEEQGVETAAAPERILPKSIFSDEVIIDFTVNKYCDSLPLYRQQAKLKRDAGLEVALSTIDDAVLRVGELLIPLTGVMKSELLAGGYIQADETPVGVQTHDKRGRNHQGYLWQYGSPGKGVVFDFQMGRGREGPKVFLGKFSGLLQTDGYKAYDGVGGPGIVHAACWSHSRRKFVEAVKSNSKDFASGHVVALMDELFAIDREAREGNLDHAERNELRQQRAPKILDELRTCLLAIKKTALPKSLPGQAANYTLALWKKLTHFLDYPELELSTNLTENSMRPVAIGRRNWLHLGSKEAGPKIAAIFSVVESCRRLNIPIRKYLAEVLPGLADRSIQSLAQILPGAYAARRPK
ncbi:MAG TPA: IS66 family transposase [Terracidiphilus sp.]